MKSAFSLISICLLISLSLVAAHHGGLRSSEIFDPAVEAVPRRPLELTRTVTHEGNVLHQSVDDHQGQITDQYVGPGGIRNIVHRHGVVVLDQVVTAVGAKQLVP